MIGARGRRTRFADLFLQELQHLGWTVGRNVRIDIRWALADKYRLISVRLPVMLRLRHANYDCRQTHKLVILELQPCDTVGQAMKD